MLLLSPSGILLSLNEILLSPSGILLSLDEILLFNSGILLALAGIFAVGHLDCVFLVSHASFRVFLANR